jgi:hypothetical protein
MPKSVEVSKTKSGTKNYCDTRPQGHFDIEMPKDCFWLDNF